MLLCPFFIRSARFLQADQFVTRLQRVEHNVLTSLANFTGMLIQNVIVNVMEGGRRYSARRRRDEEYHYPPTSIFGLDAISC